MPGDCSKPADAVDSRALLQSLRVQLERREGSVVEVRETHMSWVLLTSRLALKLKKAVALPFVDLRDVLQRERCCREEVRLNRRLAPRIYRAVLPVRGSVRAPRLSGMGPLLDHLVCMRRFPDQLLWSYRAETGLSQGEVDALASRIAAFHLRAEIVTQVATGSLRCRAQRALAALGPVEQLPRLGEWIGHEASACAELLVARARTGFVRDVHGDLHLANVVSLPDGPTAFDCIEFDSELRRIDVMEDIAFLTMDLNAHGREAEAWRFLDRYLELTGDHAGTRLLRLGEVYRALVRAQVTQLGSPASTAIDYVAVADQLSRPAAGGPLLVLMHGLSGSGKSHVASALLEVAGAVRVRSDVERRRLHTLHEGIDHDGSPVRHDPESDRCTYDALARRTRAALRGGLHTIVDATFLSRARRDAFLALAAEEGRAVAIVECMASDEELGRRLLDRERARGCGTPEASDAGLDALPLQRRAADPLTDFERTHVVSVETGLSWSAQKVWLDVQRVAKAPRPPTSTLEDLR